ncbi:GAF domain-containing sensor histidine kinase [Caballeronia sp. AZ7_KS35]|uniref:GAF domain-containing sensor histidine kinase n=1 Tax=Caballeronia sp. AZ7_KS35 TaxID=2921762 RepID=UPI00202839A5|nr:GAF domain-containing sensor histidine kinase [Caballeronia sp. AZ7_KS35]
MENFPNNNESDETLARDIGAVARIGAVPAILHMICEETGMGFAAVARVTDLTWTACAVHDDIGFGLKAGGQLDLHTTLCFESRAARASIAVDDFSTSPTYRNHRTPALYRLESYISVPIILPDGEYFGNLCAVDARPHEVSNTRVLRMFEVFASLIALQLDSVRKQSSVEALLADERRTAALREEFIAVLGHDLRNPLSAFNATAELLCRRKEDELVRVGQRLGRTVSRMAGLIDDVMDFARGRLGGGLAVNIQCVADLGTPLRAVIDELCDANPLCTVECDIELVEAVDCDRARMQQLLSNLLANALSHGAKGAPVTVTARLANGQLVLSVRNSGKPIPSEVLTRIFEPYYRPSTSVPGGGLGLGLYICKQIVDAHGGSLTVTSTETDGTVFIASIPQRQ